MQVGFRRVDWEFVAPLRIAYRTRTHAQTVQVELQDGDVVGRGEALGVSYHGESADTLLEQLRSVERELRQGVTRTQLQTLLPAGGARNALDCALWDIEAKRGGGIWKIASLGPVRSLTTAFTLGVDTPQATAAAARRAKNYSLLKLKLMGEGDVERVAAVRDARSDARIIVDANQAWNERQLQELTPQLAALRVELIEQPLAVGKDDVLATFASPVPLCADESCQTTESLPDLIGKYEYINIKLDKTGGLTEALRLARHALQGGFKLMVGSMGGSSLSMAPAFVVGQLCQLVDLDSPLLTKGDVAHPICYDGNLVFPPDPQLWG